MSELQLGLLAIGALAVAGVLAYNRWQERGASRDAGRRFGSGHPDVLVEPGTARREPPPAETGRRGTGRERPAAELPDARIDYVVELDFPEAVPASALAERWKAHEHRYAKRALLAISADGASWQALPAAGGRPARLLRAGLQLATRAGAVGEAELIEFRAAIETLAAAAGAAVAAPEMRQAVEAARSLDQFCAEADLQVVFHVVPSAGAEFSGERVRAAAEASGLTPHEDGGFVLRDGEGALLYTLDPHVGPDGSLTLAFDVARAPGTGRSFQSMASFARQLAAALGGAVVDDAGNALDERAVAAIAAQLEAIRGTFEARGIAPGSPEAIRLFS